MAERVAGMTGLEPATNAVTRRYSNQLSYIPKPMNFLALVLRGIPAATRCLYLERVSS